MASSSVDFPVPFSPTKKQTRLEISRVLSEEMVGMLNGYSRGFKIRSLSSEIVFRRIIWSTRVDTKCILMPKGLSCSTSPAVVHDMSDRLPRDQPRSQIPYL